MKLVRIAFTAKALNRVPAAERGLLVFFGHAINELNVLNKWLLALTDIDYGPTVLRQAHVCQQLVLFNSITGKLHEAWQAMQKGYFRSKLSASLDSSLEAESLEGLHRLKGYFSHNNLIETVRNNFAFHYSIKHASEPFPEDTDPNELVAYLAEPIGHSLFQFAETAVTRALLNAANPEDHAAAMDRLLSETQDVVRWFNDFAHGVMTSILERNGLFEPNPEALQTITLENALQQRDLRLDYFFEIADDPPHSQGAA